MEEDGYFDGPNLMWWGRWGWNTGCELIFLCFLFLILDLSLPRNSSAPHRYCHFDSSIRKYHFCKNFALDGRYNGAFRQLLDTFSNTAVIWWPTVATDSTVKSYPILMVSWNRCPELKGEKKARSCRDYWLAGYRFTPTILLHRWQRGRISFQH